MLFSFPGAPWRALLVVLALGGGGSLLTPDALARERAASNGGSGAKPEAYASQERRVAHSRTRDGEAEARLVAEAKAKLLAARNGRVRGCRCAGR